MGTSVASMGVAWSSAGTDLAESCSGCFDGAAEEGRDNIRSIGCRGWQLMLKKVGRFEPEWNTRGWQVGTTVTEAQLRLKLKGLDCSLVWNDAGTRALAPGRTDREAEPVDSVTSAVALQMMEMNPVDVGRETPPTLRMFSKPGARDGAGA